MSRSVPEWIAKHDDAAIPARVKDRVMLAAGSVCLCCQREIARGLRPEFDHIVPLILGGEHREANLQVLCHECHAAKTSRDIKIKAKVARVRKRHRGIRRPRTMTRWRRFDGSIVEAGRQR